ncbi:hypothetical protein R2R35_16435 [Anaerocolumna sp. AGMB13020]|uniref:hypothetical protein n=1 Tax=Anaerocolumna sp. AGMB13020 TaxID=3081750 RepID=UPI002954170D|nr:hypothetical protein [Anaerocolumna sp. AGMB13020]WOO35379.1 hypothetical protein R2R35_16435 [Anaerocolumna sp. AGMB13020]
MKTRRIILLVCIAMAGVLLMSCRKDKKEEEPVVVTVTPSPTIEATPEVSPTPAVTEEPEEEEGEELTDQQAIEKIEAILGEENYYFELLDDHLNVSDRLYYIFEVSDGVNVIEPNIIVDKLNGEVLCYNSDGTTAPFTEHPLYNKAGSTEGQEESTEDKGIGKEQALKLLSEIPHKTLQLSKELKEYVIIYDDWPSNIKGNECYGINVHEKGDAKNTLAGVFYVALDGSKIYLYDTVEDKEIDITPKK